jgi:type I restriction enzyme S subunit
MKPRIRSLSEFCSIKHGFAFPSANFGATGTHIVVSPGNFREEGGFRERGSESRYYTAPAPIEYVLAEHDLLVVMTEQKAGLLGSTALIPATGRYLHNQRLGPVTELNEAELDRYFLYHVLNSQPVRQQISVTAGGTKVRHSSPDKILAVSFWWVPLTEQKKIAAILSVWDQAIELTERLIAAKQQRKAALMQHLLTGNVRLPGFRHMHWRACELGDVASNSARRIGGDTPPPVYSVTNSIGMVPMDESVVGESIDRYKAVAKFDFAYNPMRINVGSIAMWYGDDEVLVSPDYVVFQCGQELDAEYLNHFRKTHYWHQFVNRSGGGSVRVRIYFSDLAELSLNLPPLDEQKAIAAVLNTQDREIELLQQKLDALRRQKKGLMQQLLTGKVRVNP